MKEFEIKNDLAEIEPLTLAVVRYCHESGIDEAACFDVQLALVEAVSNTIKYGYQDKRVHFIRVRVGLEPKELFLEIEDDAGSFNPLDAPAPDFSLPVEERPIGGLGVYLMRTVMDQIDYQRAGAKNVLRMKKAVVS
jgi:serine/threonine-protein kinase RsbW